MIASTQMLLDWLGRRRGIAPAVEAAQAMGRAIVATLADPKARTGDIRGAGTTASMTAAIVAAVGR
jgi:3-isopropylmalate dehydrogenase